MNSWWNIGTWLPPLLAALKQQGATIMATMQDVLDALTAMGTSMTALQTAVTAENADIDAALAVITSGSATPEQLQAAVDSINAAKGNIDTLVSGAAAEVAKIKAAVPTAP